MGILVQREFSVPMDHRTEFERQSRNGVWQNMLYNGAQMIAYGTWAFGGPGDVVTTHSVYADFDHWTATRPWGAYATDAHRVAETAPIRAIFAGRPRLITHSRAAIIDYDTELSEPAPFYRNTDDPLAPLPVTFGRQSVVAETRYQLRPEAHVSFRKLCLEERWPALRAAGARLLLIGADPLAEPSEVIEMTAFTSISHWHEVTTESRSSKHALSAHRAETLAETTRLLMIQTDFGAHM